MPGDARDAARSPSPRQPKPHPRRQTRAAVGQEAIAVRDRSSSPQAWWRGRHGRFFRQVTSAAASPTSFRPPAGPPSCLPSAGPGRCRRAGRPHRWRTRSVVTYGLMGMEPPSASRMPPTIEMTANTTLSSGTSTGDAVTRMAAAAGVTTSESTSSAPTTWTDIGTARPSTIMKARTAPRTGTPAGGGDLGVDAGEQSAGATSPPARRARRRPSRSARPAAGCPRRRSGRSAGRTCSPLGPCRARGTARPSPSPNGIRTPMIELRSRARTPSDADRACRDQRADDRARRPRSTPSSSAAAAPAKDSSLMPCTANGRSRIMTKTPTARRPRRAPRRR